MLLRLLRNRLLEGLCLSGHLALTNRFDSAGPGLHLGVPILIHRVWVWDQIRQKLFYRFWVRILVQSTWSRWVLDKGDDRNANKDHSPTQNLTPLKPSHLHPPGISHFLTTSCEVLKIWSWRSIVPVELHLKHALAWLELVSRRMRAGSTRIGCKIHLREFFIVS